ncbi:hypothetical protein D3C72_1172300 [compost metagenome]
MKNADAASRRIRVNGNLSAAKLPANTTGTLAISMPRVVPMITSHNSGYCAASITVAICVLSPISARKNAISVVRNGPNLRAVLASSSSILSGTRVHSAVAAKLAARIQCNIVSEKKLPTQAPTAPAAAWLARVAATIPAMIGQGLRKRAARMSASSCVLSPISAKATIAVGTSSESSIRGFPKGRVDTAMTRTASPPRVRCSCHRSCQTLRSI